MLCLCDDVTHMMVKSSLQYLVYFRQTLPVPLSSNQRRGMIASVQAKSDLAKSSLVSMFTMLAVACAMLRIPRLRSAGGEKLVAAARKLVDCFKQVSLCTLYLQSCLLNPSASPGWGRRRGEGERGADGWQRVQHDEGRCGATTVVPWMFLQFTSI